MFLGSLTLARAYPVSEWAGQTNLSTLGFTGKKSSMASGLSRRNRLEFKRENQMKRRWIDMLSRKIDLSTLGFTGKKSSMASGLSRRNRLGFKRENQMKRRWIDMLSR
ncbi:hypothetical protein BDE02_09G138200 [Populus trichocarpa]|nr:hypothetical protein BDE02_09G138200 [Populus trichocarpa]